MEKIYMEENTTKKRSFFRKFFNDKGSVVVTFVLATVAILGLVSFGFDRISFAADFSGSPSSLPERFISDQGDFGTSRIFGETRGGQDGILPILGFYTKDTKIPIFCIEYNVSYEPDKEYRKDVEVSDVGLVYLMSQLYPNKKFKDASGNELAKNIQVWLTQSALWSYLYEVGAPNSGNFASWNSLVKEVDKLYNTDGDYVIYARAGSTLYDDFGINNLIAQAKVYRSESFTSLSIVKNSDTISVTNDGKYYQSDLVSVVGTTSSPIVNSFEGYSVDLSRAPEGTILVDESGNVYDDVSAMSPTSKFYVRVPVDKVTDANKDLEISILGHFKMYGAYEYVSDLHQKVVNVNVINKSESRPLNISIDYTPDVPNTGMGTAQTLYFIGLIILLSGVGVLYANAKPAKSE